MNYLIKEEDFSKDFKLFPTKVLALYRGHQKKPVKIVEHLQRSFDESERFMLRSFERCELYLGSITVPTNSVLKIRRSYSLFLNSGLLVYINHDITSQDSNSKTYDIRATVQNNNSSLIEINKNVFIGEFTVSI